MVSWRSRSNTFYGEVLSVQGDSALIDIRCDDHWGEERTVALRRLRFEPPEVLSVEALGRFCRFEITYTELKNNRQFADIMIPEPYQITPEDLKAAVENYHARGISEEKFADEYFWPLWDEIYNGAGFETAMNGPDDYVKSWLPDPVSAFLTPGMSLSGYSNMTKKMSAWMK